MQGDDEKDFKPMPFINGDGDDDGGSSRTGTSSSSSSSEEEEDIMHGYQQIVDNDDNIDEVDVDLGAIPLDDIETVTTTTATTTRSVDDQSPFMNSNSLNKLLPRAARTEAIVPGEDGVTPPNTDVAVVGSAVGGEDFPLDVELVKRIASSIQLKSPPPTWLQSLGKK